MGTDTDPSIGEMIPTNAWSTLETEKSARLIDVRTSAEWKYVGVPDLSELNQTVICTEWLQYPEMSVNPHFVEALANELGDEAPGKLMFLCRSGVRSLSAAKAVTTYFAEKGMDVDCFNVLEGFEGDLDANGHRGKLNGWTFRGLAWRQS